MSAMKKYCVVADHWYPVWFLSDQATVSALPGENGAVSADGVPVYLASAVDALLRELRDEIVSQSGLRNEYQDWSDALAKIDTALMERVTK